MTTFITAKRFFNGIQRLQHRASRRESITGIKWAKFKAKVYIVKLPDFITVEMLDVPGNPVETLSLKPDPNDKIVLDAGKSMSFSEVKAGDVITFWKSEKRLDAKAMPASTAASWLVLPPQKSQK